MKAFRASRIFDGERWYNDAALLVDGDTVSAIVPASDIPAAAQRTDLGEGILAPGFVDLQVNGGGGIMLNDRQDAETIATICAAHARFGTTALLPTLITDTPDSTRAAVAAGEEAARRGIPGFLGLHLEGPHLAPSRKGAHDPALMRPMDDSDEAFLVEARRRLPNLMVTLAPDMVPAERIARLASAGVAVSLGHSDATLAQTRAATEAGARMVTHLFNAMSPLGHREPGMVGAALALGNLSAGLIADGFHVDPDAIGIALRGKAGPGKVFLVTDAMATLGADLDGFMLNGRAIRRNGGRLTLEDGTLAGADLDMASAVRFMHSTVGVDLGEALRMASFYPADALGVAPAYGRLSAGSRADLVHLADDLTARATWIGGEQVF